MRNKGNALGATGCKDKGVACGTASENPLADAARACSTLAVELGCCVFSAWWACCSWMSLIA
jgi:hypothetical protein